MGSKEKTRKEVYDIWMNYEWYELFPFWEFMDLLEREGIVITDKEK